MADTENPHTKSQAISAPPQARQAGELRQFSDAVLELNIARKNFLIYPSHHEQVQRSLNKAFGRLIQALGDQAGFSLTILKNGFMVDQQELDSKNPVLKEFSQVLKQLGVAVLSFQNGLQKDELLRFLELLALEPREAALMVSQAEQGSTPEVSFKNIHFQCVDYSRLRVTEEEEIHKTSANAETDSIWRRFVTNLVEDGQTKDRQPHEHEPAPVYLANLMNQNGLDISKVLEQYKKTISEQLDQENLSEDSAAAENEDMGYFRLLIQELNPPLCRQFLSATFDSIERQPENNATERILRGLGQEVVLQILRYAKAEGKEISPSLFKLIHKVGHLSTASGAMLKTENLTQALPDNSMQQLLDREAYEVYVDDQYDQFLAETSLAPTLELDLNGLLLDPETGLNDRDINIHTSLALMRLMIISGDLGGYRDWARQLALILYELVDNQAFECLAEIFTSVQEEHQQQEGEKKKIAALVLRSFSDTKFISSLVDKVESADEANRPAAIALLAKLGEPAALEILDAMETAVSEQAVQSKLELLEPFGIIAAREAALRLDDPRSEVVCRMLRVVRRLGDPAIAESIRRLLDHEDADIRTEALTVLLKYKNPWGILRLREMLNAPWSAESAQAVSMAGDFKIGDVQAVLMGFVNRSGTLAADLERRTAALQALGKIGDPACIPELEKIAKRRHIFSKKYLLQFKQAMFASLGGYPFKAVENLIMMGLKQKDDTIRLTCNRLLKARRAQSMMRKEKMKDPDHAG
jgi:hypothetical protein